MAKKISNSTKYNYIPLNVQFSKEKESSILYDDYEEKLLFDGQLLGVTYDSSARELKLSKVLSEYNDISRTITINTSSIQPTSKVNELSITNMDIEESGLLVKNIDDNEKITISENMMIQSNNERIFGNDFNYIFPRLKSGQNTFNVTGNGYLTFKYTIPIKVGDCVDNYLS